MIYTKEELATIEEKLRTKLKSIDSGTCLGGGRKAFSIKIKCFHIEGHWLDTRHSGYSIHDYPGYEKRELKSRFRRIKAILVFPLYNSQDKLTDIFWLVESKNYNGKPPAILEFI